MLIATYRFAAPKCAKTAISVFDVLRDLSKTSSLWELQLMSSIIVNQKVSPDKISRDKKAILVPKQ